jgi:hypothetical protein
MLNFIIFLKHKFNFSFFKKNIYNIFIIFFIFAFGFTLGHLDIITNQNLIINNQIIENNIPVYFNHFDNPTIQNFNYIKSLESLTFLEFYAGLGYIFVFLYMYIIGLYNDYKKERS